MATEKISDTRWALKSHSLEDTTCLPGDHTYRLVVSDPSGNPITAQIPSVTVPKKAKKKGKKAKNADQASGDDQADDEEDDN